MLRNRHPDVMVAICISLTFPLFWFVQATLMCSIGCLALDLMFADYLIVTTCLDHDCRLGLFCPTVSLSEKYANLVSGSCDLLGGQCCSDESLDSWNPFYDIHYFDLNWPACHVVEMLGVFAAKHCLANVDHSSFLESCVYTVLVSQVEKDEVSLFRHLAAGLCDLLICLLIHCTCSLPVVGGSGRTVAKVL